MITVFEKVNNINIPYIISPRRQGDIDIVFADVSKIFNEIGWKSTRLVEDICRDGLNYIMKQ